METQERLPQGLGNLAENARLPHSHKPIIIVVRERREKNGNSNSATEPSTESDQAQFRNPNGVALELANFRAIDQPEHGMANVGKLDRAAWAEFSETNESELKLPIVVSPAICKGPGPE